MSCPTTDVRAVLGLYLPNACTPQLCASVLIDDNVSISEQVDIFEHYFASVGDNFDAKMN